MRSLRWRLALSFTLLSTFAVLIQAVALFVSTEEQEEDMIDEVVNAALDNRIRQGASPEIPGMPDMPPSSLHLRFFRMAKGLPPPDLPVHFAALPAGNHEWYAGQTEYHVGIREHEGERLYLLYDTTEHEIRLEQLRWNLLVGLALLSLASLWLGYWLSGRLLYQLERIKRRLQRDDDTALNEPGLDREVALLAEALDQYRQRNRQLLEREREFTANVSHELRTPLTRIRTSAELLTEDEALPERGKDRAQRIVSAVDVMESRLRGLLFLARELALERRPLDLREIVLACAAQVQPACDAAGVRLNVDVPPQTMVDADTALLQLLLDNLIGNAVRYAAPGGIDIRYADGAMTVADAGPGIAPEHLARVFDRHYRASDAPGGMGLGLSIAKRVCDAHGWQCTIDSVATEGDARRGTRVTVRF